MALFQKSSKFYQWLFYAISLFSLILIGLITALLIQLNREKQARAQQLDALVVELADTLNQTNEKQEYLDRLMRDSDFRERLIREKLGRARPDEIIYHFNDK